MYSVFTEYLLFAAAGGGSARAFAGTLVSAVFENLGYRYQSYILDSLRASFTGDLGGFVYLIGVAAAVFAVAIRGEFKLAPWLLIGPPLFLAVVLGRTQVSAVQWQFAMQPRPQGDLMRLVDDTAMKQSGGMKNANVSTLFAKYNYLISATMQELMRIIIGTKRDADSSFIIKGQLFASMYSRTVDEPGLTDLIKYAIFSQCRDAVEAGRTMRDELATPDMKKAAELDAKLDKSISLSLGSATYVADRILKLGKSQGAGLGAGGAAAAALYHQRTAKIRDLQEARWSCRDVWGFVYAGLIEEGALTIKSIRELAELNGAEGDAMLKKLAAAARLNGSGDGAGGGATTAQNLGKLSQLAALYILRNTTLSQSYNGLLDGTAELSDVFPTLNVPLDSEHIKTELARTTSSEWSEKTRMIMAAENLPYYQGIILFTLATTFPFFAMLLLVPGKHPAFMLWFALWLWAKSWDLGFAMVMQLDDVLFSLMSMNRLADGGKDVLTNNFELVMYLIREIDPTFHIATYYNIIAVSLMSIPMVTSHIIMGGLSGGAGLVAAGMNHFTGEYAKAAHGTQSSAAISNIRFELSDFRMRAVRETQKNRLGVPLIGKTGGGMPIIDTSSGEIRIAPSATYFNAGSSPQGGKMSGGGYENQVPSSALNRPVAPRSQTAGGQSIDDRNRSLGWAAVSLGFFRALGRPTTFSTEYWQNLDFRLRKSIEQALPTRREIAGEAARTIGKVGEHLTGAFIDTVLGTVDHDIKVTTAHAQFDATYSSRGKELAFMLRLYGAIEVPVSAESGDIAEADRELGFLQLELDAYASFMEGMAEGIAGGRNVAGLMKSAKNTKELYERARRAGADVNRINWGSNQLLQTLGGLGPKEFDGMMKNRLPFMLPGLGHR